MIMRRGKPLLLPVSPLFIWISLVAALTANVLINTLWLGRSIWVPDILALTLVFWCVHQPSRIGVGIAFMFGLMMDVHQTTLFGQHGLAYAILAFLAVLAHRRLLWFPVPVQALHIAPLFILAHVVVLLIHWFMGHHFPGWSWWLTPVLTAALWPVISVVLLAPQRRALDPDANRPL
jgi:rod shape-determining protein MreD